MLSELKNAAKIVGIKQLRRALREGTCARVFLAENAEERITAPIVQLCREAGIPVEERIITVEELMAADEIILCSTTKNVLFVYEIDGKSVGGKAPALRERLQELFAARVWEETGARI